MIVVCSGPLGELFSPDKFEVVYKKIAFRLCL